VTENAIALLVTWVGKTKPMTENPGGNTLRRLRFNLGCDTFVAAADTEMVNDLKVDPLTYSTQVRNVPVL
jgi:hypothetical protein